MKGRSAQAFRSIHRRYEGNRPNVSSKLRVSPYLLPLREVITSKFSLECRI